nr:hypothetical protein CFP56_09126 [Quercus suber]
MRSLVSKEGAESNECSLLRLLSAVLTMSISCDDPWLPVRIPSNEQTLEGTPPGDGLAQYACVALSWEGRSGARGDVKRAKGLSRGTATDCPQASPRPFLLPFLQYSTARVYMWWCTLVFCARSTRDPW